MRRPRESPAVALALVAGLLLGACGSPERRLAQRLERLADRVEKDGEESGLTAAARATEIVELFAEPFEVIASPLDFRTTDRGRLIRAVLGYRRSSDRIRARIYDLETNVDAATARATTVFTAEFTGAGLSLGGGDAYRFRFSWLETADGQWLVDQAELLEIRRSPGL